MQNTKQSQASISIKHNYVSSI